MSKGKEEAVVNGGVPFKGPASIRQQAEDAWQGREDIYPLDLSQGALGGVLADGVYFIKSFANVTAIELADEEGLLLIDTGSSFYQADIHAVLRRTFSTKPVTHAVYTHRHVDHVGGVGIFDEENKRRGRQPVQVIAHANVAKGFDRYKLTNGYNARINQRQFATPKPQFNSEFHYPDVVYDVSLSRTIGGVDVELYHARGETDDATWVFVDLAKRRRSSSSATATTTTTASSAERIVFAGDFLIWAFPNCGNPQKVQRHPLEWAAALRKMAEKRPTILVPGHGSPVFGAERAQTMLLDTAAALEHLCTETIAMINAGRTLNDIVHSFTVPPQTLAKPYLRAIYDEPQFIVNNLWRLYAGWYDQNPAHLKPPKDAALATEISDLCGCERLVQRAEQLAAQGTFDVACSLVEVAHQAHPANQTVGTARANIYQARSKSETSLMARNIYRSVSREVLGSDDDDNDRLAFLAKQLVSTREYLSRL